LLPYKTSARYLNYRVVKNIVATTISFSLSVETVTWIHEYARARMHKDREKKKDEGAS